MKTVALQECGMNEDGSGGAAESADLEAAFSLVADELGSRSCRTSSGVPQTVIERPSEAHSSVRELGREIGG